MEGPGRAVNGGVVVVSGIRGEPGRRGCSCVSNLGLAASAVSAKSPSPRVSHSLVARVGPRLSTHIYHSPCAPPSLAPLLWLSVSFLLCRAPTPYAGPVLSVVVPCGASSGRRSLDASPPLRASDASHVSRAMTGRTSRHHVVRGAGANSLPSKHGVCARSLDLAFLFYNACTSDRRVTLTDTMTDDRHAFYTVYDTAARARHASRKHTDTCSIFH